ncbi:MAG: RHS repeat-associated core domain-containing protein [Bacteroidota bacterium]
MEQVKWFNGDYEEDSTSTGLKKYHYISGGNGLTAIFVKDGSASDSMYHVFSDHLGSLITIVNASTNSVENYSFNAWGIPRDPDNWDQPFTGSLFAGRGYTGHEHLTDFNLINMNGRIYDPVLGRFLSPDPYVQLTGYPNNFNRYTYCLNNPLIYVDPYGEAWWHWLIGDILTGGLISSTAAITATQLTVDLLTYHATATGIAQGIKSLVVPLGYTVQYFNVLFNDNYYEANSKFQQAMDIDLGLFQTDPNRSDGEQAWQLFSRFTWEHLQTELGRTYTHARNMFGHVDRVDYFGGATFSTRENQSGRNGISIGNYININTDDEIEGEFENHVISDPLYMHEYGHTFDSRSFGMSYLFL